MRNGMIRRKFVFAVCVAALVALLLPTAALAAPTLADSYPANPATDYDAGMAGVRVGQTFTADAGTVSSAVMYFYGDGTALGNIKAYIYAVSGTPGSDAIPTGAPIATSLPVNAATLAASPGGPVTFTFSSSPVLTADTKYILVADTDSAGGVWSKFSMEPPVYAGNNYAQWVPSSWTPLPDAVAPFEVWQSAPVVSTPASSPWSLLLAAVAALGLMVAVPSVRRRTAGSKI